MLSSRPTGAAARTSATTASSPRPQARRAWTPTRPPSCSPATQFAAEVRAQEREAARLGIHAVPTFVFDGRLSVSGAQDPAVLAQAARQALGGSFGER